MQKTMFAIYGLSVLVPRNGCLFQLMVLFAGIISQKHKAATGFTDYEIHDSSLTFHEAKSMCEHLGATLAPFKENHNFSFLITNVKLPAFGHFWIQVYSYLINNNCTCLSTLESPSNYRLEATNCSRKMSYICWRYPDGSDSSLHGDLLSVSRTSADATLVSLLHSSDIVVPSAAEYRTPSFLTPITDSTNKVHMNAILSSFTTVNSVHSAATQTEIFSSTCRDCATLSLTTTRWSDVSTQLYSKHQSSNKAVLKSRKSSVDIQSHITDLQLRSVFHKESTSLKESSSHSWTESSNISTNNSTKIFPTKTVNITDDDFESVIFASSIENVTPREYMTSSLVAETISSSSSVSFYKTSRSSVLFYKTLLVTQTLTSSYKDRLPSQSFQFGSSLSYIQISKTVGDLSNVRQTLSTLKTRCVEMCSSVYNHYTTNTAMYTENVNISEMIKDLTIDNKRTGKMLRRVSSAYDSRSSSKAMGIGAMLVISTIFVCIVAMDLPRLVAFFKNRR